MGNSQQKQQIEKFHQQKMQQIQTKNPTQESHSHHIPVIQSSHDIRMLRSKSMPLQSSFNPSKHQMMIVQSNQNLLIHNQGNRLRSASLFKPIIKQIIIQQPQKAPILTNSTLAYNSQSGVQRIQTSSKLVQYNQVSPLSFMKKGNISNYQDESISKQEVVSQFNPNKSYKKYDENSSPIKRDSHWRVDQLLQAIQPIDQQNIDTQSALLDLNFNQLKPMSSSMSKKSQVLKTQSDSENVENSFCTKGIVRFSNTDDVPDERMSTPPRQSLSNEISSFRVGQSDKSSEINHSLSIKEQFDNLDCMLQKQLNYSKKRNQKLMIKNILSQQDQTDQKLKLDLVQESNEDEYSYINSNNNNNNNNNNSIKQNIQIDQQNERNIVKEHEPQSCYQSEIKKQDLQTEESSFMQQISFLNQKIALNDKIQECKGIQKELIALQEEQTKKLTKNQSTISSNSISQNMYKESQKETGISNTQVLQPKSQLKVITNQLQYNINGDFNPESIQTRHRQIKTISNLPEGQTYYYYQPQSELVKKEQQESPIKNLQQNLMNTHSLDAGLISPNNNQITYYRNQSPISNQLELPVSFTYKDNLHSGQLQPQKDNKNYLYKIYDAQYNIQQQNNTKEEMQQINAISRQTTIQPDSSFFTDIDNVRMASVKVNNNNNTNNNNNNNNNNLSPLASQQGNQIYYHQPQWNSNNNSDIIFSQNMQNRILDVRLSDKQSDFGSYQTPPHHKSKNNNIKNNNNINNIHNINSNNNINSKNSENNNNNNNTNNGNNNSNGNYSRNNSSISSVYTFNQKGCEKRQEKHKIRQFTLKIDSVRKEIVKNIQSDEQIDEQAVKDTTSESVTDQNNFCQEQQLLNEQQQQQQDQPSECFSSPQIKQQQQDIVQSIENIQQHVKRSILKSNQMISQTLNASSHNTRQMFSHNYDEEVEEQEQEEEVELEPYSDEKQNAGSNNGQCEKSPIRRSKIKIYHGKIEHIHISQSHKNENLILYKLDEQLNALIPVVIANSSQQDSPQKKDILLKTYDQLLHEQYNPSIAKSYQNTLNIKYNYDDILRDRNTRSSASIEKKGGQQQKNSSNKNQSKSNLTQNNSNSNSGSKLKYFQHQVNPETKDNAYHQVLMKYSDKMLNQITKTMIVPNSYGYQHLNQKLYKQRQTNITSTLSSSKKHM